MISLFRTIRGYSGETGTEYTYKKRPVITLEEDQLRVKKDLPPKFDFNPIESNSESVLGFKELPAFMKDTIGKYYKEGVTA